MKSLIFGRGAERMSHDSEPRLIYQIDLASRKMEAISGSQGYFSPRLSPDGRYLAAIEATTRRLILLDRETASWRSIGDHPVADPTWSNDGKALYFQVDSEADKPVFRIGIPSGATSKVATLQGLRPLAALDYRRVALAPGDLPVVSAWTSNVNVYSVNLDRQIQATLAAAAERRVGIEQKAPAGESRPSG